MGVAHEGGLDAVTLLYKGKSLQYSTFICGEKGINQAMITQSQRTNYKPKLPMAKLDRPKADIFTLH